MEIAMPKPISAQRERWAWYLYDFGNSAYAAVVLLAVYATYFEGQVVGQAAEGSRLWGLAVGIAMLVVAVISPVLGTIADFSGAKKRFLLFFTTLSCFFTAMLFFVQRGDVFTGMLFFILAEIGYRAAQVFYNALLPDVAAPEEMSRVSGNGWAIGSAGGILCLIVVLALITLIEGSLIVRLSMVITALFFALSAAPIFAWLRERAQPQPLPKGESYMTVALKRLGHTIRAVKTYREFVKFILAFLIYNDGILMVLDFGAILGAVLFGMGQQELIVFMIIVQVMSIAGAYVFGLLADRFSGKRALIVALLLMIVPVFWLYLEYSRIGFYLIGALAGFALTGVQSVSRSVVGTFAPPGRSGEFYGFFAVVGRTSSFIGPTVFGLTAARITERLLAQGQAEQLAKQSGHRLALFTIAAFLVVGLLLLLWVNEARGRAAATSARGQAPAD
jgi:UMF1 family MFS transporter